VFLKYGWKRVLNMEPASRNTEVVTSKKNPLFYGWVIVATCTLFMAVQWGIQYSFSIFFKPLTIEFGWSRAATAGVYSLYMIAAGVSSIPLGWLADKFGPAKLAALSGFLIGLGLILASMVTELWQLYLTFGLIVGIGAGGTFAIGTGVITRWFVKRRGLALGIASSGVGVGILVMSPLAERLIANHGWSTAYLIIGIGALVILISSALLLRRDPEVMGLKPFGVDTISTESTSSGKTTTGSANAKNGISLSKALHSNTLWIMIFVFFSFNVSVQLVMVHLANYATDQGISPLAAALVISFIGIGSAVGRLVMGTVSDRIGSNNSLIICCAGLTVSLVWLIFAGNLWMLYIFAFLFSFAYGGEIPQMTLMVSKYFGITSVTALVGAVSAATRFGGALGSWLGGQIFDMTQSYAIAFVISAATGLLVLLISIRLKKIKTLV
jgi:OFA family oxalate/formate antiporter-like MFS transporter